MVHVPPPDSAAPQVVESTTKSAWLAPETDTETGPEFPWPLLVTVNVWSPEADPTTTDPKSKVVGLIISVAGLVPVPWSVADAVPPGLAVTDRVAFSAATADG